MPCCGMVTYICVCVLWRPPFLVGLKFKLKPKGTQPRPFSGSNTDSETYSTYLHIYIYMYLRIHGYLALFGRWFRPCTRAVCIQASSCFRPVICDAPTPVGLLILLWVCSWLKSLSSRPLRARHALPVLRGVRSIPWKSRASQKTRASQMRRRGEGGRGRWVLAEQ